MNKAELASYCASLSSLLADQDTSGVHLRSQLLGKEFEKHWDLLKKAITEDNRKDEAREARISHDNPHAEERYRDTHRIRPGSEPIGSTREPE